MPFSRAETGGSPSTCRSYQHRGRAELKPANLYQGCIFAWKAFREGKTITAIKYDTKKGLYPVNE
jgi:hypothetical protein